MEIVLKCLTAFEQGPKSSSQSLPGDLPLLVFLAFQRETMGFNLLDSSQESSETWLQMARKELCM